MDNDEDDDGNFTKWMSSYWGHGAGEESAKERKRSFRRPARNTADRRASLPCMVGSQRHQGEESQLENMRVKQLHAATMPPAPVHPKNREEKEVQPHPHARRVSSDESSRTKAGPESRISTIPELAESFERMLRFRKQKVMSLSDADSVCLICHEEMCNGGGGIGGAFELHCSHRFHKECIEEWLWSQWLCPSCSVYVVMPEPLYWSSGRLQFP
ncbi:leukemia NUP98 fusion partner 1 isoform X3 [Astyanax mexicanus]|uniref:leukemia NUP98 fusion partner 1 isoform X3 n=1 Tax=Astyanax mexicanus TaxID=7994 RepID=UPI0020CB44F8|nr:leukemia NUP98 fusion partner 1 isoform X3 [Astyanax mexicanus]